MNTDDLFTEFRSDVPLPDESTRQRIYAHATSGRRRLPQRKLALAVAAAACATAAALVTTGVFNSGAPSTARQSGPAVGDHPVTAITVAYNRSGGILNSIDLTVNPSMADARIELQVLHTDATAVINTNPSSNVVFTEVVSATNTAPNTAAAANGPSTWSGSLSPSDWSGGCQSGLYDIVTYSGGPGAALNGPAPQGSPDPGPPVDEYHSGWFSCSGS